MKDVNLTGKRVAVIGSRTFQDKDRLYKILDKNKNKIKMIVSGGAAGADSLANEWAKERGFPCLIFYPKWKTEDGQHDRGAGFRRNFNIIQTADVVLAFWDKVSRGTKNSIEIAEKLGKPVKVIEFGPSNSEEINNKAKEIKERAEEDKMAQDAMEFLEATNTPPEGPELPEPIKEITSNPLATYAETL
jgi:predicted Rossmann fold nucleotide-binding protein DprA/Smf involved in DNA uptake